MRRNTIHYKFDELPLRGVARCSMVWALALGLGGCFSPDDEMADGGTDGGTQGESGDTSSGGTQGPSTSASTSGSTSGSTSAGTDTASTSAGTTTGMSDDTGSDTSAVCNAGEVIGCDGDDLVTCNDDGTGEESTPCTLGCFEDELRCYDVAPSNDLAEHLDAAAGAGDLDLGSVATIDTDDGTVTVDNAEVDVMTVLVQSTPPMRVLVVKSLVAQDVTVSGTPALAIVSDGDIQLNGLFSVSATSSVAGPGALNNATCQGGDYELSGNNGNTAASGAGGGAFGSGGAEGGDASSQGYHSAGGTGGSPTGNASLEPLRGGCDAGAFEGLVGRGGGAVQIVSRTAITIEGIVAANGSSRSGGGSGGGILLEAPQIDILGNVVANGGAGAGGGFIPPAGEHGRTDDQPAQGGPSNDDNLAAGGDGAAGNVPAMPGDDSNFVSGLSTDINFAGHGGGGVGRIRINVHDDALNASGIVSPDPSTSALDVR